MAYKQQRNDDKSRGFQQQQLPLQIPHQMYLVSPFYSPQLNFSPYTVGHLSQENVSGRERPAHTEEERNDNRFRGPVGVINNNQTGGNLDDTEATVESRGRCDHQSRGSGHYDRRGGGKRGGRSRGRWHNKQGVDRGLKERATSLTSLCSLNSDDIRSDDVEDTERLKTKRDRGTPNLRRGGRRGRRGPGSRTGTQENRAGLENSEIISDDDGNVVRCDVTEKASSSHTKINAKNKPKKLPKYKEKEQDEKSAVNTGDETVTSNENQVIDLLASLKTLSFAEMPEECIIEQSDQKSYQSSKRRNMESQQASKANTHTGEKQQPERLVDAAENVKKVFNILLQKFNGRTYFSKLMNEDTLPQEAKGISWYKRHRNHFLLFKQDDEIKFVSVYSQNARLCHSYNKYNCRKDDCKYLHICMHFVTGGCKYSSCLSHNFFNKRNKNRIQEIGLGFLKNKDIANVVRCSTPEWCEEYQNGIKHDKYCPLIHVCRKEDCNKMCGLEHDIKSSKHNQWVLTMFHMCHYQKSFLTNMLLTRELNYKQVKENKKMKDDNKRPAQTGDSHDEGHCEQAAEAKVIDRPVPKPRIKSLPSDAVASGEISQETDDSDVEDEPIGISQLSDDSDKEEKPVRISQLSDDSDKEEKSLEISQLSEDSDGECNDLCEKYIWSQCSKTSHYHGPNRLPYLWLIKMEERWLSIDEMENEKIERSFCDRDRKISDVEVSEISMALITYETMTATIYFKHTNEETFGELTEVQRLSTPSYVTGTGENMAELTQWCWYFQDDRTNWLPYEPANLQYTLEMKYQNEQETYFLERERFQYEINFEEMIQTNLETKKTRPILRRPIFVSSDDVRQCRKASHPNLPTQKPMLSVASPDGWAPLDCYQTVELVKLKQGCSEEAETIHNLFFSTMDQSSVEIISLFRIQNPVLWEKYCSMKKTMVMKLQQEDSTGTVNEKHLFHGTDSKKEIIRGICHNNIDFRLSGKNGTVYGDGAYFARDAKYSHSYTSGPERFMFLSKVLVGHYTKGDSKYRRPPARRGHHLYDSCVNDTISPSIYVIFDIAQSYPEYLIEYAVTSSSVSHAGTPRSVSHAGGTNQTVPTSTQLPSRFPNPYTGSSMTKSPTSMLPTPGVSHAGTASSVSNAGSGQTVATSIQLPRRIPPNPYTGSSMTKSQSSAQPAVGARASQCVIQ